jgi:uncharacterized protein (DUF58 family)
MHDEHISTPRTRSRRLLTSDTSKVIALLAVFTLYLAAPLVFLSAAVALFFLIPLVVKSAPSASANRTPTQRAGVRTPTLDEQNQ